MASTDIEISNEIGQYLYNIAPDAAKTILMIAALAPTGDVGRFEFWSNDGAGEHEFSIRDAEMETMLDLLSRHQQYMVEKNKQAAWTRCDFTVNVDTGKFSMDLGYEEFIFKAEPLRQ